MSDARSIFVKDLDRDDIILDADNEHTGNGPVFNNLFREYERVVVRSLVTSFGLDMLLISDRRGGDVDTIHTVRDPGVKDYADKRNAEAYSNRRTYDKETSKSYHQHPDYRRKNAEVSSLKKSGNLEDTYTGRSVPRNANIDLDHTISAKEIHDDPGRVLADTLGEDIANRETNLNPTDRSINRPKGRQSSDEFLRKLDEEKQHRQERIRELRSKVSLTDKERAELNKHEKLESVDAERVKQKEAGARKAYDRELARTYYTSPKFLKATAQASLKKGAQMGLRQCLGLILTEVWFAVREEFPKLVAKVRDDFNLGDFLRQIADTVKLAFSRIKEKYKELLASFRDGMIAGILSSITSTLINIFATTAKNVGRILRESWASIVESVKILVFNPDNLPFGEMLRAVAKVVATSVSIICGTLVQEAIAKMTPVKLPVIADALPIFVGSLVAGIMSISMLYFLNHSKLVQRIVEYANKLKDEFDHALDYYREVNKLLTDYVAQLAQIDYDMLEKEVAGLKIITARLDAACSIEAVNTVLHQVMVERKIHLPYTTLDELDAFMNDKEAVLVI